MGTLNQVIIVKIQPKNLVSSVVFIRFDSSPVCVLKLTLPNFIGATIFAKQPLDWVLFFDDKVAFVLFSANHR